MIKFDLQYFASKKGVGSTKNGRDSNPKMLGAKRADGQLVKIGQVLYRQRGTRIFAGKNVGMGKDHTLFAKANGTLKFVTKGDGKKFANVEVAAKKPAAKAKKAK